MAPPSPPLDLRTLPLFRDISEASNAALLDRHLLTRCDVEQTLVMEQDWGESLFLVLEGLAKVRVYNGDGSEVVLSVLGSGDLFGEIAVLDEQSRSADVVALTPMELVKLRGASFCQSVRQDPALALAVIRLETARLRDLSRRFAVHTSDATTRLLATLAYLAGKASLEDDPTAEIPPLPQRELGLLSGLSRETASRTLNKLRQRGTIADTPSGGLRLVDLQPLRKRALLP
jgi:CRP/FNR family cyclic AMP-dependent transcriptional regulator